MAYQVLARKWRPQLFDSVIGQLHVARALQNAVSGQRVAHAYLFSGPRGVGKTTMARILAKALNCAQGPTPTPCNACPTCREIADGSSVDVLEIDGASNTSVDDVRELREAVKYMPLQGKHKIFIIDEVHMLSNSAFNALLKTLEEPPPHMVFIFATTEPQKIPLTIRSRCQHYQFKRISRKDIIRQIRGIVAEEKIQIGEREMFLLAKGADGSMRDALGLLDQALSYGGNEIRHDDLLAIMGVADRNQVLEMVRAIQKKDAGEAILRVQELVEQGHDLKQFCHELVQVIRDLTMFKIAAAPEGLVECPPEDFPELKTLAEGFSPEELQWYFKMFSKTYDEIKNFFYPPFLLEMTAVRACRVSLSRPIDRILDQIARLEDRVGGAAGKAPTAGAEGPPKPRLKRPPPVPAADGPEKDLGVKPPGSDGGDRAVKSEPGEASRPPAAGTPDHSDPWKRIIQVAKQKRPYLASYLDQGVLTTVSEEEVVVGYPRSASFFVELIQKQENISLIRSLIEECFGRKLRFRVVLHGEGELAAQPSKDLHPTVKEALKIFGGDLVDPGSPK